MSVFVWISFFSFNDKIAIVQAGRFIYVSALLSSADVKSAPCPPSTRTAVFAATILRAQQTPGRSVVGNINGAPVLNGRLQTLNYSQSRLGRSHPRQSR